MQRVNTEDGGHNINTIKISYKWLAYDIQDNTDCTQKSYQTTFIAALCGIWSDKVIMHNMHDILNLAVFEDPNIALQIWNEHNSFDKNHSTPPFSSFVYVAIEAHVIYHYIIKSTILHSA